MTAPPVPKRPHDKETLAYLAHITKYCEERVKAVEADIHAVSIQSHDRLCAMTDAYNVIDKLRAPRPFLTRLRYLITGKIQ